MSSSPPSLTRNNSQEKIIAFADMKPEMQHRLSSCAHAFIPPSHLAIQPMSPKPVQRSVVEESTRRTIPTKAATERYLNSLLMRTRSHGIWSASICVVLGVLGVIFFWCVSSEVGKVREVNYRVFFCCLGLLSLTSRCLRKAIPIKSLFQKYIMFCAKNIIVLSLLIYCFLMDGFQKIYQNNTKNEKESMEKEKKKIVSTSMFVFPSLLNVLVSWCYHKARLFVHIVWLWFILFSCCSVLLLTSSSPSISLYHIVLCDYPTGCDARMWNEYYWWYAGVHGMSPGQKHKTNQTMYAKFI